jgi:hypothetical protein
MSIVLSPAYDGFFIATVNLSLQNTKNAMNFSVTIPHIKALDEVHDRLKPAIDQIADDMKRVPIQFDKPI